MPGSSVGERFDRFPSRPGPPWRHLSALAVSALFTWSFVLALPAAALTHSLPERHPGVRRLGLAEMRGLIGRQAPPPDGGTHPAPLGAGSAYPWQSSNSDVNTGNGNKLTSLPLVGWTQRGGLPVALTLYHNSESTYDHELGQKWTFSFNLLLTPSGTGPAYNQAITWGNGLSYTFTNNGSNVFSAPTGIYDTLVKNVDGTFTLTTKDQIAYHFTGGYADTITDENANTLTITRTSGYVTRVTDATSRSLTFGYDTSNRIHTITDPLSRQWTLNYDASNQLQTVALPVISGTTYGWTFGYDANHDITSQETPGSNTRTANYNTDGSINWSQDAAGNRTSYSYTLLTTTISDPNSHTRIDTYSSGTLTQSQDGMSHHQSYVYDTSYNRKKTTDERGKIWQATYDSEGNALTTTDPLSDVMTCTYTTHNKLLTVTIPTGEETVNTYDGDDNLTEVDQKDSLGTIQATQTYTVNGYGETTDYYDADTNHTQYGYSANGDLASVTTPLTFETQWTYDALGVLKTRTDALTQQTTYTPDAWERIVTTTYPDTSQKTFGYDPDNNLTSFTDPTGTTTRDYDADDRLLWEKHAGSYVVQHSYDATGQLGLLSTTTDAGARVLTYAYDANNRLHSVSETAGTTTYAYDATNNETGITHPNGTTVTQGYDDASQLTSVLNQTSTGTTLSAFSYVLDTDSRRHTVTEADGSVVTDTYDWGSRLTSEVRTGTHAYTRTYVPDAVGNRTSETVGTATTTFTYDSDNRLKSTASTTGGFVNRYGYDKDGRQNNRKLAGQTYVPAYDYDGQLTSLSKGGVTLFSYQYDALGRRVSRTAGTTTTDFLLDGSAVLLEQQGGTTTATYTYGNALIRKDGETPLFDGLGSERTVTNSSQTVTGTATYEGFGQTVATTGSSSNPYEFAATSGYRNDGDVGLMLVGARYYDAQVGGFITRDTDLDQQPYLYCEHDPINQVDPSGHFAFNITYSFVFIEIGVSIGSTGIHSLPPAVGVGFSGISVEWTLANPEPGPTLKNQTTKSQTAVAVWLVEYDKTDGELGSGGLTTPTSGVWYTPSAHYFPKEPVKQGLEAYYAAH